MGCPSSSLDSILTQLDQIAPDVPLLALGQTVLWDEPMKSGVAIAAKEHGRTLIAGVHDTDYFAKLPGKHRHTGQFKAFAHNDTSTKGLWSAAGEFSALFGSETMATKQDLVNAGLRLNRISRLRPQALDTATEAWGWRGIVSLEDEPPICAEIKIDDVKEELRSTFYWAIDTSLDNLSECHRHQADSKASELKGEFEALLRDEPLKTLSDFYVALIPKLYEFVANQPVDIETTHTQALLKFNIATCDRPRFEILEKFLDPESRWQAVAAYNQAVEGTEIYTLDRFGSGAIPFDLVIPGRGRGTVRVGNRGIVIMTRKPVFITLKTPITTACELAEVIERKFGPDCTLIGKAVSLIGMLAREFIFVFHEGASSYVKYTRKFHSMMESQGVSMELHPILRVRYNIWDQLSQVKTWFRLPQPLQKPFGTEELCAPSFASRWREVSVEQKEILDTLAQLKRPVDLINYLDRKMYGSWSSLSKEYAHLNSKLESLSRSVAAFREERKVLIEEKRQIAQQRAEVEMRKGDHFRAEIFEKSPPDAALQQRSEYEAELASLMDQHKQLQRKIQNSIRTQKSFCSDSEMLDAHDRRREIELEAELKRMRLVMMGVMATRGLQNASHRPSAWWLPLVSPEGTWFGAIMQHAECYLEPLSTKACSKSQPADTSASGKTAL